MQMSKKTNEAKRNEEKNNRVILLEHSSTSKVLDNSHFYELKMCHLIIEDEAFPLKTYLTRPRPGHKLDS